MIVKIDSKELTNNLVQVLLYYLEKHKRMPKWLIIFRKKYLLPYTWYLTKRKEINNSKLRDIEEVIAKKKKGRRSLKDITIFDSTGLAIQDTALAHLIYKKAKRLKLGRHISFF